MRNHSGIKRLWLCLLASGSITLTTCGLSDRQWTDIWQSVITSTLASSASAAIDAAVNGATNNNP